MRSRVRRVGGDLLVSIGVLGAVMGVLVSVDVRVREQLQAAVDGLASSGLDAAGGQLRDLGLALFDAVQKQSIEHAPLLIFGVVATVLLLALART
jgi:hypothetical protein